MPKLSSPAAHSVTFFPSTAKPRPFSWRAVAVFVALSFAAAGIGQLLSGPDVPGFYRMLERPPLSPPPWVFAPVWSVLYLLIGVSGALMWQFRDHVRGRQALTWWGIQLALNAAWSGLFFGLQAPGAALMNIVMLWAAIAAYTLTAATLDRRAAWLFVPYLAWVSFAAYLNAGVWWLNR